MDRGKRCGRISRRFSLDLSFSAIVAIWALEVLVLKLLLVLYTHRPFSLVEQILGRFWGIPGICWDIWMALYGMCYRGAPSLGGSTGYTSAHGTSLGAAYALCLGLMLVYLVLLRWMEKDRIIFRIMDIGLFWTSWSILLGILGLMGLARMIRPYEAADYQRAFQYALHQDLGVQIDRTLGYSSYYQALLLLGEEMSPDLKDIVEQSFDYVGLESMTIEHVAIYSDTLHRPILSYVPPDVPVKVLVREGRYYLLRVPSRFLISHRDLRCDVLGWMRLDQESSGALEGLYFVEDPGLLRQ